MLVSDFDYALPTELIAQHPAQRRGGSRLLRLHAATGALEDRAFADLAALVGEGDAVVLNDTRVIRARLAGRKPTGGKVEILVERILGAREALALIRASHAPAQGTLLRIGEDFAATVRGRQADLYRLEFSADVERVLEASGALPLPPYIDHPATAHDAQRYQTVYAAVPGAVAAPTAGLHFDEEMLAGLAAKGAKLVRITLHVGSGTFQPVRSEQVEAHRMHRERYRIAPESMQALENRRVLAVGTTSLRALESAAATGRLEGETELFVYPGFRFNVVNRLLTNFHLPRSTLLMLACAFGGKDNVLRAYAHAVRARYRFFSYGDAMLIER
jgi:S-adenosylmethionine:tRNA ribosyltransferase-isomerase